MNRKIMIAFIVSALTGSFLMAFLLISDYMKGPELELHSVTVEFGEEVRAWSFVSDCSEPEASIHYVEMPDFSVPGGQEVSIEAIDANGKKTVKKALLRISIIKGNLKLEASNEEIQLNQILVQGIDEADVSFRYKPIKLNHIGVNEITLLYQGVEYKREIMVFDSIAPEVVLKEEISCYQYHEFDARSAVEILTDATEVFAGVKGILDTKTVGEYPVTLVFTDEGENKTEIPAVVKVIADMEPPVLYGVKNQKCEPGEHISYLDGVSAEDAVDGFCEVTVDASNVNPEVEGSYEVIYRAEDKSGNEVTQTAVFTIQKKTVTEELLREKAEQVLSTLVNEAMSTGKKAYEIYQYVYSGITYTGHSDKTDWQAEALRGLTQMEGDCFTYMAVSKILLDCLGIENQIIERIGGNTEHYWLLVNAGSGWYHFDPTRRQVYFDGFMATDADVEAYTRKVGGNFYVFNREKYPKTPETKFLIE